MSEGTGAAQYHHPDHQDVYSTRAVQGEDGEAADLFKKVENILYADYRPPVRPVWESNNTQGYIADFSFSFIPHDAIVHPGFIERMDITVRHVEFIGSLSLRQSLDINVSRTMATNDGVTETLQNHYFIEQLVSDPLEYFALVKRADVTTDRTPRFESMTVFDSDQLRSVMDELRDATHTTDG